MRKYRPLLTVLVLVAGIASAQQWLGIIATSRAVDWSTAGVPGGIPSASWTQCAVIAPYGSSGAYASPATINNAINSAGCAGGSHYVLLSAGSFFLTTGIIMKAGVEVRGAGPDQTKIFLQSVGTDSTNNCGGLGAGFCFMGMNFGAGSNGANVSGGTNSATWSGTNGTNGVYTTGATSIRLTNVGTAGIANGQYIYLDQNDDTAVTTGFLVGTDSTISPPFSLEGGAPGRCSTFVGFSACVSPNKKRSQIQVVKVVSGCPPTNCTGAGPFDITIPAPGIYGLNWRTSQAPGAWFPDAGNTLKNSGIQGLSIDYTATAGNDSQSGGIVFFNASENWAYNIRSIKPHRNHIWFYQAAHNTVLSNYFYDSFNAATQSYGVEAFQSSDNLVANNIFQHSTTPIVLGGSTGSAYVYNFGIDAYIAQGTLTVTQTTMTGCPGACLATYTYTGYQPSQGGFGSGAPISIKATTNGGGEFNGDNLLTQNVTGTTFQVVFASGTNVGAAAENALGNVSNGTLFPFSALHDAGVNYNLYEGNIGTMIYGDLFHGTSNANTFFRNYLVGAEKSKNQQSLKVFDWRSYHRYWNVIGNLLGKTGTHTVYENYTGCVSGCTGGQPVYEIGFGNSNGSVTVQPDPQDRPTSMRWGNYDVTHPGTPQFNSSEVPSTLVDGYANPVPASQTLPASMIFSARPSWLNSSYSPNPPFPAIGPDVTGGAAIAPDMFGTTTAPGGHAYANPAELCYQNVPLDPAYPNGWDRGVLLFNANTCYSGSAPVITPNPPTSLVATASGASTINLTWTASTGTPTPTAYTVYRGTVNGGPYALIKTPVTTTSYSDTSLAANTYFYVVTAFSGALINSISGNGSTATVTCSAACSFPVNSSVNVQGASIAGFNGSSLTVTSQPTSTTFTYANSTVGSATGGSAWLAGAESARSNQASAAVPANATATLSPATLTYAARTVGTTSPSQTLTFTNTSGPGISITISSISLSGANAGDFAQTNNCPGTLASGSSCGIFPTFTPTAAGARTATVSVFSSAVGSPHSTTLNGTGVAAAPIAQLTPSSHDFGQQSLSTTSTAFAFTLTNSGTGTLSVTSITPSGDFAVSSTVPPATCGTNIAPGNSCLINVTFTPTATGGRVGSISIVDNAAGSPHVASVTGTGITTKCQMTNLFALSGVATMCGP